MPIPVSPDILLLIGVVLLLGGSQILIKGSRLLAYKLRISELFISMTVVALGTSLPELTISSISVVSDDTGLGVGNIIGSSITNATLILGLAILVNPLRIGTSKTQKNASILVYITALFIILYLSSYTSITIAGVLLGMALISFLVEYLFAVQGRAHEDKQFISHYPKKIPGTSEILILIVFGIIGLITGGTFLVHAVETLSVMYNLSTTFLGLTLTALITTMPELITTVLAQFGKDGKIALGNILGSNIYNLTVIGGILSIRPVKGLVKHEEFVFLAAGAAIIWFFSWKFKGKTVPRIYGVLLVITYLSYLFVTSLSYKFGSLQSAEILKVLGR